jgi:hypothetical protein
LLLRLQPKAGDELEDIDAAEEAMLAAFSSLDESSTTDGEASDASLSSVGVSQVGRPMAVVWGIVAAVSGVIVLLNSCCATSLGVSERTNELLHQ